MVSCTGGSAPTPTPPPQPQSCTNLQGVEFFCAPGSSCCGGMCTLPGGVCCTNDFGTQFTCASGNQCCGGGCQAPGSKCCDDNGQKFPLPSSLSCPGETDDSLVCTNPEGVTFPCAQGD